MLAPRDSRSRDCRRLDGLWRFRFDPGAEGTAGRWWTAPLRDAREMPVPASYNDLVTDVDEREHVGDVWYQRDVRVPASWEGRRIVLRCDAATHHGTLWAGDTEVARHAGGYTPFEADITAQARCGEPLRITVRVSNELTMATIPPGVISPGGGGRRKQRYFHDFFNYSGLHRSVWLYATPRSYVADVSISTDYDPRTGAGRVTYHVEVAGDAGALEDAGDTGVPGAVRAGMTSVVLRDAAGEAVADAAGPDGVLTVPAARPWGPADPYLYRLDVVHGADEYSLPVGIRTVQVAGARLLLNGQPVRLHGFGMHEDAALRGKGHDDARMVRDFALLKWIGANSFRTSHYPYAEEVLDYADRQGLLVIDEVPAVGLHLSLGHMGDHGARTFGPDAIGEQAAAAHLAAISELIARDRNHPSVIAWSIANEPDTAEPAARGYFAPLVAAARELDASRPVCFANVATAPPDLDVVTDLFDLICVNRYYGWYAGTGDLEAAERDLEDELRAWARHGKPILVTEFGADALPGLHALPPAVWSEDYQAALIAMSLRVFRRIPEVIGEHVWNFADFATAQAVHRPGGNHKGVFTRDRQPKAAAWLLRHLWKDASPAEP
ncbi:MAG TPA: beta-glucuronidase [Streptosporangiaceae bacterium]|jgi:beta-glucuronidase|nr:beta-glucuronidase [Streptosporangiaceae bacterium]